MTVLLSWVIAALGIICFGLLGSRSHHKWQRRNAERELESLGIRFGKAARRASELYIENQQQRREICELEEKLDTANADAERWRINWSATSTGTLPEEPQVWGPTTSGGTVG